VGLFRKYKYYFWITKLFMNTELLTPFEMWQLEKYNNILPQGTGHDNERELEERRERMHETILERELLNLCNE